MAGEESRGSTTQASTGGSHKDGAGSRPVLECFRSKEDGALLYLVSQPHLRSSGLRGHPALT